MHIQRLDLNLLQVFDAVAETRSVTAAADRLSLSQPAVSHALNRLRRLVDDTLFLRGRGGLAMTPRAAAMVGPVRAALESLRGAVAPAKFDPAATTRPFHLAASDYGALVIGPALLRQLLTRAPNATVTITPAGGGTLAELERGGIDAALWGGPLPRPPFRARELFRGRFIGLVGARHPLARARGAVDLDDYLAYPHVMVGLGDLGRSPIDVSLKALGRTRRVAVRAPNFVTGAAALSGTDLIMSLPAHMAGAIRFAGAVRFALPLHVPEHAYRLIWHRRTDADPACNWLRELVTACAPNEA